MPSIAEEQDSDHHRRRMEALQGRHRVCMDLDHPLSSSILLPTRMMRIMPDSRRNTRAQGTCKIQSLRDRKMRVSTMLRALLHLIALRLTLALSAQRLRLRTLPRHQPRRNGPSQILAQAEAAKEAKRALKGKARAQTRQRLAVQSQVTRPCQSKTKTMGKGQQIASGDG